MSTLEEEGSIDSNRAGGAIEKKKSLLLCSKGKKTKKEGEEKEREKGVLRWQPRLP